MHRVELFRRLVAFDTTSSQSNLPAARFISDLMIDRGARVREVASEDGEKTNLVITFGPDADDTRGGLVLSGHIDCVPALEEGWESNPFVLTDRGDRYVARGASDMKGFLAVALDAAMRFDRTRLRAPLVLLLTYDEEVGTLGAKRFVEQWPAHAPLPRATVIGEPTSLRVVRMHKGHLKVRIDIRGRSAHSGYPHLGINAIELASRVVEALARLRVELESDLAPNREHFPDVPFVPLNVGTIRGGAAINVVPDRCTIELGARPMPGGHAEDLVRRIEQCVREAIDPSAVTVEVLSNSPPMLLAESTVVYRELSSLVGQSSSHSVNFATDAGWLQKMEMECVLFGPGSIEVAHRPNEFVPKHEFEHAAVILDRVIERFCVERVS